MTCYRVPFKDSFAVVCTRGSRRMKPRYYCVECLREGSKVDATKLCDGSRNGGICNRGMCDEHVAASPEAGIDLCGECEDSEA